jgi:hypothetical protein
MNLRAAAKPEHTKTIAIDAEPPSGQLCGMAPAVWVKAARRVTKMAPLNNLLTTWFFISLLSLRLNSTCSMSLSWRTSMVFFCHLSQFCTQLSQKENSRT